MSGARRKLRVPELLRERGWTALDLVRRPEFLLPPATAYRLARRDRVAERVSLDILERLSDGFGIPIEALWDREEVSSGE